MYNQPPKTTTCQEKKLLKPKSAISAIISASPARADIAGGGKTKMLGAKHELPLTKQL